MQLLGTCGVTLVSPLSRLKDHVCPRQYKLTDLVQGTPRLFVAMGIAMMGCAPALAPFPELASHDEANSVLEFVAE